MMNKIIPLAGVLLIVLMGITAHKSFQRPDTLARSQAVCVIRIGYRVEAPYAFVDPDMQEIPP